MGGISALIAPLLTAVGEIIKDAINDRNVGRARTKLEHFTALTLAMLKDDRREAEHILNARFPEHAIPVTDDELYDDNDSVTSD